MRANPVTISPKTTCSDAFRLMHEKDIYKLPVVAGEGDLTGIVTKKDLLYALPSSAALLSLMEIDSLLGNMTVDRVMTRRVISVSEECPLEEAARIMADDRVGSLPVTRGNRVVGIMTKNDIFRAMVEALGGRAQGFRITIRLHADTGELGAITDGIVRLGGKLISLCTFWGGDSFRQTVILRVYGVDTEELMSLLEKDIGVQVIDCRQSTPESQSEFVPSGLHTEVFSVQKPPGEFIPQTDAR
jgi:acetoin utilization protein AcuB